ncbi:MAG: hypothetical protein CMF46_00725 [Legionellales bacterium]|nr:hypothetical protein [Legionellales bacterium]|tara:strand:+ start:2708 stop:3934 length:1227 start_codon:yes stop_codon:yes gene_type:complete
MEDRKTEEQLLTRLVSGAGLLEQVDSEYFKILSECSGIDQVYFDEFYMVLIRKFAEVVQCLKEDRFASEDRVLAASLKRAGSALQQLRQRYSDDPTITEKWEVLAFAVYSSALLHNIGYVFRNKVIHLTTDDGTYQKEWFPLKNGTPYDFGEFYRVRFINSQPEDMCDDMTRWLAMDIMSELGINWIAQNREVFDYWRLAIISLPDAFDVLNVGFDISKEMEIADTLRINPIQEIELDTLDLAEDFLIWLKQGIQDKSIDINSKDAIIHKVDEGVLVDMDKAVNHYVKEKKQGKKVELNLLIGEIELTGQAFINRLAVGGSIFVSYLLKHPVGQIGRSFRQRSLLGRMQSFDAQRITGIVINEKYMPSLPHTTFRAYPDGHRSYASVEQYLHSRETVQKNKGFNHTQK